MIPEKPIITSSEIRQAVADIFASAPKELQDEFNALGLYVLNPITGAPALGVLPNKLGKLSGKYNALINRLRDSRFIG